MHFVNTEGRTPTQKKTPLFLSILIISSVIITLLVSARAAGTTNLLYVSPTNTTAGLPPSSTFYVAIKVANFDPFNGWDIHVKVDPTIINPIAFDISQNIFAANASGSTPTEVAHCINNSGSGCNSNDGPGILRSAVAYLPPAAMGDGLLFNITYTVVSSNGFTNIAILYDIISGGGSTGITHTTLSGTYGTQTVQPDFKIGFFPTNPVIAQNLSHNASKNATVTITSIDGFSGTASLSARASIPGQGPDTSLLASFYPTHVFLAGNGQNSSTVMISTTNATFITQYFINVTATIGSIAHWQILPVQVNPIPDFILSVSPSILKIHATNSGSSTVTIDTQSGYSGPVKLNLTYPNVPGLAASLGSTDFTMSPGQPATTVFSVRTPDSLFPFVYLINITASGQAPKHSPFTITVKPPSPNFDLQISSAGYVIQAGKSRTFTLTMTSVDYFKGQLFLLATSFSGVESTFTRSAVALDYGNSSTSMMTVTTDANLAPGNHDITLTELGTSFLNISTNHTITMTITVTPPQYQVTILGAQPPVYFGVIGVLWITVIGAAVLEIRRPKAKRFLS